jgi:hypothetical protein
MSPDEAALIRLSKEKRGEVKPLDLSDNLSVQLGVVAEALNRSCVSATLVAPSPTFSAGGNIR